MHSDRLIGRSILFIMVQHSELDVKYIVGLCIYMGDEPQCKISCLVLVNRRDFNMNKISYLVGEIQLFY